MSLRIAMYWHNGRSLGHTAETGKIAHQLKAQIADAGLSGLSGAYRGLDMLPEGMDVVKLPSFVNFDRPTGWALTGRQGLEAPALFRCRAELCQVFLKHYAPQLFIVNHLPRGADDELVGTLEATRSGARVLSLRGILFDKDKTQARYFDGEAGRWIAKHFDHILVHTDPEVFRLEMLYDVPDDLRSRVEYTGYLEPPAQDDRESARRRLGLGSGAVAVASMGGGQGALPIWQALVSALRAHQQRFSRAYLVTGPYLETEDQIRLKALVADSPWLTVVSYCSNLGELMSASDVFIGAAGANMVAESLARRANAILIPRQVREPEQQLHASFLAKKGLVRTCSLEAALSGEVARLLPQALAEPLSPSGVKLGGAERYVALARRVSQGGVS